MHDLAMLSERCDQDSSDRVARVIHRQMKHLRARIFRKAKQLLALTPGKIARRSLAEVEKRDRS